MHEKTVRNKNANDWNGTKLSHQKMHFSDTGSHQREHERRSQGRTGNTRHKVSEEKLTIGSQTQLSSLQIHFEFAHGSHAFTLSGAAVFRRHACHSCRKFFSN